MSAIVIVCLFRDGRGNNYNSNICMRTAKEAVALNEKRRPEKYERTHKVHTYVHISRGVQEIHIQIYISYNISALTPRLGQ